MQALDEWGHDGRPRSSGEVPVEMEGWSEDGFRIPKRDISKSWPPLDRSKTSNVFHVRTTMPPGGRAIFEPNHASGCLLKAGHGGTTTSMVRMVPARLTHTVK